MVVVGSAVRSGNFEDVDDFGVSCGSGVVHAHADGERAALKTAVDGGVNLLEFGGSGFAVSRIAEGEKHTGIVHDGHAHGDVANADAVVDEGVTFTFGIPIVDVIGANFEFERSGDAVVSLEFVIARLLTMFVEVDEAWGDDEAVSVDGSLALERGFGDDGDFAVADANVADGVAAGFGIHDAATGDDDVVEIGIRMSVPHREGGQQADRKQDECRASQEEEDLLFEGTPPSLAAKKAKLGGVPSNRRSSSSCDARHSSCFLSACWPPSRCGTLMRMPISTTSSSPVAASWIPNPAATPSATL